MIPVEEARARILHAIAPTPAETVPLADGHARVLAQAVRARVTQPPAAVSAMDGYAVRAAEAQPGAALRLVGAAPAGRPFAGRLSPGEAVRIFTGGFVPEGADAILLQEDADIGPDIGPGPGASTVAAREAPAPGRWIRPAGLDFREGEELLPAGRRLTPRDIGLAAAGNHPWLVVHRRPRIGILATGDEIALPGEPIPAGGIVSSNAHGLAAFIRARGGEALVLPIAPDDRGAIAAAARGARGCGLLVTTGGASVGEHDLVQEALGPDGFQLDFWKVAMRPGKPLIWGDLGGVPLLGLPGNPVSALVCAYVFLAPVLAALQGLDPEGAPPILPARLGAALPANDGRADHLRATLARRPGDGALVASAFARQDSSMVALLARADCLILRAPHAPAVPEGHDIRVIPLD